MLGAGPRFGMISGPRMILKPELKSLSRGSGEAKTAKLCIQADCLEGHSFPSAQGSGWGAFCQRGAASLPDPQVDSGELWFRGKGPVTKWWEALASRLTLSGKSVAPSRSGEGTPGWAKHPKEEVVPGWWQQTEFKGQMSFHGRKDQRVSRTRRRWYPDVGH